jgi:hypothetical protein
LGKKIGPVSPSGETPGDDERIEDLMRHLPHLLPDIEPQELGP